MFAKRKLDAEMDEEMRSHIELRTQANIESGMEPNEARYAASREFGWKESIKETCRDQRGVRWIDSFFRDIRFAFRQLRKNPGFATAAVLTLALCIGANLSIFAVVDAILIQPLPFPQADRLVTIFNSVPKAGIDRTGASLTSYYERQGKISAFSQISAFRYSSAIIGEAGATERQDIIRVTPEFFTTLGAGMAMGRAFTEEELTHQTDGVVILTDGEWKRLFHGNVDVLGHVLRLDGVSKTVVGVLSPGFRFLSSKAQIFLPLSSDAEERGVNARYATGKEEIARLKPGATVAQAQSEIDAHYAAHAAEFPWAKQISEAGFYMTVAPLRADHVAGIRPTLVILQSGALFLLFIGAVNIANLLLVRASSRSKELAIRQSLGAGPKNVAQQVMVETILLVLIGGVAGLSVGAAGVRLLSVFGVDRLPLGAFVTFDGRLAAAGLALSIAIAIAMALPIAWFNLRRYPGVSLRAESRGDTANFTAQRLRQCLIAVQIALAFVLLTGAGLLGVSLKRAMNILPGFQVDNILTGQISLPSASYRNDMARIAFTDRLLEQIQTQPGVTSAGIITDVPVNGLHQYNAMTIVGRAAESGVPPTLHNKYGVTGDYFKAMGIPLREGRFLENSDSRVETRNCVVDEDFAKLYWPQGGAVGQRVYEGPQQGRQLAEAFTVVGVVGRVKQGELADDKANGAIYFPYRYNANDSIFIVLSASQTPDSLGSTLRSLVRGIDPDLPIDDLRSMKVRVADSLIARRSPALLAGIFSVVALLLAAIGTYGVLSYAVAQRRREIAVRVALGAQRGQVIGQFVRIGAKSLAGGLCIGGFGAWAMGRSIESVLFRVDRMNPAVLVAVAVVMIFVVLIAVLVPSRRAAQVEPMEALKCE